MFRKKVFVSVLSWMLLVAPLTQGAGAGHTEKQIAQGIAVALLVSALAKAAATSANAHTESNTYSYNHGLGARENAVAACIHRAHRVVRKAGARYLRLDKVTSVGDAGDDNFKVVVEVTGVYKSGQKKSTVNCVVDHNLVKNFFSS